MKTGLVLEGGAMRGMFTAGVLDVLMENGQEVGQRCHYRVGESDGGIGIGSLQVLEQIAHLGFGHVCGCFPPCVDGGSGLHGALGFNNDYRMVGIDPYANVDLIRQTAGNDRFVGMKSQLDVGVGLKGCR